MVVTCENCESKFKLDDSMIKDTGSKVRCSSCQHVFTVFKPTDVEVEEPVQEQEIASDLETDEGQTDETSEESLEFDLFESEQKEDDGLSLEDFGLEGEGGDDATPDGGDAVVEEDQITADDLGFGDDALEDDAVAAQEEAIAVDAEDDLGLEGLSLEEPSEDEPEVAMTENAGDSGEVADEELLFEDLALEDESDGTDMEASGASAVEAEEEDDISFEDLSLDATPDQEEDAFAEEVSADSGAHGGDDFPDDVPVASLEDGDDSDENTLEEDIPAPEVIEQAAAKKRISLPLMICLVVVLVGGGAYAGFTFLQGSNIKIPFLESIAGVGGDQTDPGNLHMTLMEDLITGGFVENAKTGRLFVIRGKVRSGYPGLRNFIRMKGILYFRDGKVAQDSIVYCGNILSDAELQTLDREAIKKRLSNRFGDNKANFKVSSGKVLPFMVVFPDIPKELGEFSVEVVDSMAG